MLLDTNSASFDEYAEAALSDGCTEMTTSLDRYAIRATNNRSVQGPPAIKFEYSFCWKVQHIPASSGVFRETVAAAIAWYPGSNVKVQAKGGGICRIERERI